MTQKEIIEFEETNTGVIRLYLEGTFYKAYERSAFAFCTRIKDYRGSAAILYKSTNKH